MEQQGHGDDARLEFLTHVAAGAAVEACVAALRSLDVVRSCGAVLRVDAPRGAP
jgi:hypothetical protein